MWFPLGFRTFVSKKYLYDDSCDIYVSDFINIWHVFLTYNEILSDSKTLNPLVEVSVEKLKDIVFKLLEDVKVKKEIIEENENILIKLESNIMAVRFQFQMSLKPGNKEMKSISHPCIASDYCELNVSQCHKNCNCTGKQGACGYSDKKSLPLLHLLLKTQSREKKLINIIKSKDAEIKDYKQEFGVRSDFMTTEPFNETVFDSQESVADNFLDFIPILDCISYTQLSQETVSNMKQGNQILKGKSSRKRSVKKAVFQDKNLIQNEGSKLCLLLDNKVIKKVKKGNEGFKIKL